MSDTTIINFDKQLKGLPVLNAGTAYKLGVVTDLAIDPTQGSVCGFFLLTPENEEVFLPSVKGMIYEKTHFLNQSFVATASFATGYETAGDGHEKLPATLRVTTDLLGAIVVTEHGRLLGNIRAVYLDPTDWRASYLLTSSWWQRWLGGGVLLPAHLPIRWSQTTGRLIVPDRIHDKYLFRSTAKDAAVY